MTSKHTPGPWIWQNDWLGLYGKDGEDVLPYSDYEGMAIPDWYHTEEPKANARLIASAPDLLEALIVLHQRLEQLDASGDAGRMVEDEVEIARAVIAKATGQ
jgi:hypothetical protein